MKCLRGLCLALLLVLPSQAKSDALKTYGDIAQLAIPGIALAGSLYKEDYEGVVQLGLTSAATLGTTFALKYGVNRQRPNNSGGKSFPSGHTASAFMGASYLHYRYGWQYGFPAYAAAVVVGISRVEAEKHHASDVIAAAAIANVAAYIFTDTFDDKVTLLPFIDIGKKNFGITAKMGF